MAEKSPVLTAEDIQVGATYRGRRFQQFMLSNNDRQVMWISSDRSEVQYDSATVALGRKLPRTTMEKFLRWAKHAVKDET